MVAFSRRPLHRICRCSRFDLHGTPKCLVAATCACARGVGYASFGDSRNHGLGAQHHWRPCDSDVPRRFHNGMHHGRVCCLDRHEPSWIVAAFGLVGVAPLVVPGLLWIPEFSLRSGLHPHRFGRFLGQWHSHPAKGLARCWSTRFGAWMDHCRHRLDQRFIRWRFTFDITRFCGTLGRRDMAHSNL